MRDPRLKILYVEDSQNLRALITTAFDAVRFRVVVAAGIDAAQFLASRERFDAVICGKASTARAVWEFISGRPTKIYVLGDRDRELPPTAVTLASPTAFGPRNQMRG